MRRAYKTVTTASYTSDTNDDIIFAKGNDGLGPGVYNPISINLYSLVRICPFPMIIHNALEKIHLTNQGTFVVILSVRIYTPRKI